MRRLILLFATIFALHNLSAQKTTEEEYTTAAAAARKADKKPFSERLVLGGNLGGFFGVNSFAQVNPMIGYRVTDWWVNGIGLNYMYINQRGYSASIYGASVWSRAYIAEQFIIHTELEYLNMPLYINKSKPRENVPVWLFGGGYQQNGFGVMVLFDLIGDPRSPYSSPIFRIGGMFGIGR